MSGIFRCKQKSFINAENKYLEFINRHNHQMKIGEIDYKER